jgi:hypothetical protein
MIPDPEASLAAYHDLRERVTELLGGVDDERSAATQVDACPAWTVRDYCWSRPGQRART